MADNTLETHEVVVLSTAHISPADDALLHDEDSGAASVLLYQPLAWSSGPGVDRGQVGWLINVGDSPCRLLSLTQLGFSREFADLLHIMAAYCTYLILDRDGPIHPDLPTFDWS